MHFGGFDSIIKVEMSIPRLLYQVSSQERQKKTEPNVDVAECVQALVKHDIHNLQSCFWPQETQFVLKDE